MIALPLLLAGFAASAGSTRAAEEAASYEARLLAELGGVAPAAVEDARAASEDYQAGRWKEALERYERVAVAAPGWSHALRRECAALRELGQREKALQLCRRANQLAPLPENALALAMTLLAGKPPAQAESAEARGLAAGAMGRRPEDFSLVAGVCSVALQSDDLALLESCSRRMGALVPDDRATLFYGTIAALSAGRLREATALLGRARAAGLDPELAGKLAQAIEAQRGPVDRYGLPGLKLAAVWAAGLALLLALGAVLSVATGAAAVRLARSGARSGAGNEGSSHLKRLYGAVLWACCVYYYLSIPIVLAGVLALGAAVFYGFMALGQIPVKLVIVLGLVAAMTVWAVLKSLWVSVVRGPAGADPGARLDPAAHPALTQAISAVAAKIGTRPVDTVFLTPGTDVAVFERGSMLRQLSGRSERCLILGVGVLEGMTQGQLKAILAHEYGHFVNRDTAGGGLALAVRRSLLEMGRTLAQGGAATWYNPAWWFVRGFYKLFLRISHGASRLQEILADRWAALAYGGRNFASGLRHVIAQSVRFDDHAERTLKEVIEGQRALVNLYRYAPAAPSGEGEKPIDAAIQAALEAEPSPYDSHPRPKDRIAWVQGIDAPRGLDDEQPAWALFADREALEKEMTDRIRAAVAANHGVSIPAEPPAAETA
jgi:Zn-dependent protease with chaperone function